MANTCAACGGTNLQPGSVQSTGRLNFRPDNSKFLSIKTADVPVSAVICVECGAVALVGDVQKLRRVLTANACA